MALLGPSILGQSKQRWEDKWNLISGMMMMTIVSGVRRGASSSCLAEMTILGAVRGI